MNSFIKSCPLLLGIILCQSSIALSGCTKAQAANDVSVVLTDTQQACAITEAATAVSPLAVDLPEVEAICGIATDLETELKAFLYDFFAAPPATKTQMLVAAKRRMAAK